MNGKILATIENYCDANGLNLTENETHEFEEKVTEYLVRRFQTEDVEKMDDEIIGEAVNLLLEY